MKKNVKQVLERLLAEDKGAPAPAPDLDDAPPAGGPALGDEGGEAPIEGGEGETEAIANENGSISYLPTEESDPTLDVISFLKAFKDACPDCWGAISEAVAAGLEDGEEGGEGAPAPAPEGGDEIPDAPGL